MKKSLSVALLTNLLVAATAFAAPELSVVEPNFNFGTIVQGKKVQHNFVIKNSGDQPLQIKDLNIACGCTAAKPSTSVVAPGRSAEIQVVFDSANFSGKVQKTVSVVSNAGKAPNFVLSMEGNILEPLQSAPRQINLGPVKVGVAKQASVTVTNRDAAPVRILSVTLTSNTLQLKTNIRKPELRQNDTGTIELNITPRGDAKVMSGYLHITTDSPHKKEITIPVYASQAK